MLLSFSIVPIGSGTSLGKQVSTALKIIEESGLPYKMTPMDTVIEGKWHEVMDLVKKCHDEIMKTEKRVVVYIKIDDKKGKINMIEEKVTSVEKRLGHALKK